MLLLLIKERLAKAHGSQCGFCSPGMVMSMYTLLRNNPKPTSKEVLRTMEGNWCRCTGYRPIMDAFSTFTKVVVLNFLICNLYPYAICAPPCANEWGKYAVGKVLGKILEWIKHQNFCLEYVILLILRHNNHQLKF